MTSGEFDRAQSVQPAAAAQPPAPQLPAMPSLPPPGWYTDPDPAAGGRERWWTGSAWSPHTARAARNGIFGADYERAHRPGANHAVRRGSRFYLVGVLLWVASVIGIVVVGMLGVQGSPVPFAATIVTGLLGLIAVAVVLIGIAAFHGVRGLRAAAQHGATVPAVRLIVAPVVIVVVTVGIVLMMFLR